MEVPKDSLNTSDILYSRCDIVINICDFTIFIVDEDPEIRYEFKFHKIVEIDRDIFLTADLKEPFGTVSAAACCIEYKLWLIPDYDC